MRSPRVFSCSGLAFPAAASWRRFARVGFDEAAALTWFINAGVMVVTVSREDIRGVDEFGTLGVA